MITVNTQSFSLHTHSNAEPLRWYGFRQKNTVRTVRLACLTGPMAGDSGRVLPSVCPQAATYSFLETKRGSTLNGPVGVMKFRHAVLHSVQQSLPAELESTKAAETPAAKLPCGWHVTDAQPRPAPWDTVDRKGRLGLKQTTAA